MTVPKCRVRKRAEYPEERIKMIKRFCERLFSCPVELIIQKIDDPNISAEVEKKGKKAVLKINIYGKVLERAFELGEKYVEAFIEHEAKHINDFEWEYARLLLPRSVTIVTEGSKTEVKMLLEKYINEVYKSVLEDAVSISLMSSENAERYLKLICENLSLRLIQGIEDFKIMYYLYAALADVLFKLPDCSFIVERTVKDEFDRKIYEKLKQIFKKIAESVNSGMRNIDIRKESIELSELFFNQPYPLTKETIILK